MIEIHVKLYRARKSYWADILQPAGGNPSFPRPSASFPCRLSSTPAILRNLQKDLLNLAPGDKTSDLAVFSNQLERFLFGPPESRNDLHTVWMQCFTQSQSQGGMRTVLHFDPTLGGKAGPELASVPWELLWLEEKYLARWSQELPQSQWPHQPEHLLVRSGWAPSLPVTPEPLTPGEPLRVLLVLGSDDKMINTVDEWQRVDSALYDLLPWHVDLHALRLPDRQTIGAWCQTWRPHIVHFIGHGQFTKAGDGRSGQSALLLSPRPGSDQANPDELSPTDLSQLFPTRPRLVILNACRSGQGHNGPSSMAAYAVRGFAEHLIGSGVLAVIAMQADIPGAAAAQLMEFFYRHLAQCEPIDLALTRARGAVLPPHGDRWIWALPVLYVAKDCRVEDIIALTPPDQPLDLRVFQRIAGNDAYDKPKGVSLPVTVRFRVGYDEDVRKFEEWFLRGDAPQANPRLVLLAGETGVGKSNLIYWLSERCCRRERRFLYADCFDYSLNRLTYLTLLRLIRDGCPSLGPHYGVRLDTDLQPNVAFNRFNDMLNSKIVPGYVPQEQLDATTEVVDEKQDQELSKQLKECGTSGAADPVDQITEAFWQDLARAAGERGLIVFLDHVPVTMPPNEVNLLQTYLIERVLSQNGNIRLVLCWSGDEADQMQWSFLQSYQHPLVERIWLPGFRAEELTELAQIWARRYFLHWGGPRTSLTWQKMYKKLLTSHPQLVADDKVRKAVDDYAQRVVEAVQELYPMPVAPFYLVDRCVADTTLKRWAQDRIWNQAG